MFLDICVRSFNPWLSDCVQSLIDCHRSCQENVYWQRRWKTKRWESLSERVQIFGGGFSDCRTSHLRLHMLPILLWLPDLHWHLRGQSRGSSFPGSYILPRITGKDKRRCFKGIFAQPFLGLRPHGLKEARESHRQWATTKVIPRN